MRKRGRFISIAIFASLATIVGATLSWACTPATFGTPATPAAPPAPASPDSSAAPSASTGAPPAPPVAVGVNNLPSPALSNGTSGSGSTSGAQGRARTPSPAAAPRANGVAPQGAVAPSRVQGTTGAVANKNFAQRASGGTVGTTSRGGQPVFARSAASAKKKGKASGDARTAPSARSAAGDLWSGFKSGQRSSVFAAQSAAGQDGGVNGTVVAALALLGIGLTGIAGAAGFLALRGRRAKSRPTAGGNRTTTKM